MKSASTLIILLGYAGLIPFVLPAGMLMFSASYSAELTQITNVYALAIICFLCGSWWGLALPLSKNLALLLSNAYFLVAFFSFIFAPQWWSLIAAILLMGLLLVEQKRGGGSSSIFFAVSKPTLDLNFSR